MNENFDRTNAVFSLLARPRRRALLGVLASREQPQGVADLASELADREVGTSVDGVPMEDLDRISVSLHHVHLPKLADTGLVTYDQGRKVAALTSRGERLTEELDRLPEAVVAFGTDG